MRVLLTQTNLLKKNENQNHKFLVLKTLGLYRMAPITPRENRSWIVRLSSFFLLLSKVWKIL